MENFFTRPQKYAVCGISVLSYKFIKHPQCEIGKSLLEMCELILQNTDV